MPGVRSLGSGAEAPQVTLSHDETFSTRLRQTGSLSTSRHRFSQSRWPPPTFVTSIDLSADARPLASSARVNRSFQ